MKTTEFNKLVSKFGKVSAKRAVSWFVNLKGRNTILENKQAAFCELNEYLWA